MPVNILMPALSPTMEKGNLAKWLKKEGDQIKTGDVIAEIETDKATMEYEAIEDGTLAEIVVPEGTNDVTGNQVIAGLAQEGEDVKAAAAAAAKSGPAAKAPSAVETKPKPVQPAVSMPMEARAPPPAPTPGPQRPGSGEAARSNGRGPGDGARIFASPLARRLAKEAGVENWRGEGAGPPGRGRARDGTAARGGRGLCAPGGAHPPRQGRRR